MMKCARVPTGLQKRFSVLTAQTAQHACAHHTSENYGLGCREYSRSECALGATHHTLLRKKTPIEKCYTWKVHMTGVLEPLSQFLECYVRQTCPGYLDSAAPYRIAIPPIKGELSLTWLPIVSINLFLSRCLADNTEAMFCQIPWIRWIHRQFMTWIHIEGQKLGGCEPHFGVAIVFQVAWMYRCMSWHVPSICCLHGHSLAKKRIKLSIVTPSTADFLHYFEMHGCWGRTQDSVSQGC